MERIARSRVGVALAAAALAAGWPPARARPAPPQRPAPSAALLRDRALDDKVAYPLQMRVRVGDGAVLLKGPGRTRPAAFDAARDKVRAILKQADPAVVRRLGRGGLSVLIAPDLLRFTDLADLRDLKEGSNAFGQSLDRIRAIFRGPDPPGRPTDRAPRRPHHDSPIVAVGEEDLLRFNIAGPQSHFHHEFAHAIFALGLDDAARADWDRLFDDARRRGLFDRRYASLNVDEFFAELTEAYFDTSPYFCTRPQLRRIAPDAFAALDVIYAGNRPPPPPEALK